MNSSALGPAAALLSSVSWAWASGRFAEVATRTSPFGVNFTRAAFAFPCFLAAALIAGQGGAWFGTSASAWGWLTLSMVASYGLGDAVFLAAARWAGPAPALAVSSVYPVWSALAGWIWNGEAIPAVRAIGLGLAVAGVAGVVLTGARADILGSRSRLRLAGFALAGLASVFWAANGFALSRIRGDLPFFALNAARMAIALGLAGAIGLSLARAQGPRPLARFLPSGADLRANWPYFLGESVIGTLCFSYGMMNSPLALGAALTSLAPVIAVVFQLRAGHRLRGWQVAAIALTTMGTLLLVAG